MRCCTMEKGARLFGEAAQAEAAWQPQPRGSTVLSWARAGRVHLKELMLQPCPGSVPEGMEGTDKALLCNEGGGSPRLFLKSIIF